MTSLSPQTLRKLYSPLHHLWLRIPPLATAAATTPSITAPSPSSSSTTSLTIPLEIGLTQRGLDDIGDIHSLTSSKNTAIRRGEELLRIEWDGQCISAADELYHAVWNSYSATAFLPSPISGLVSEVYGMEHGLNDIWEDTVLVRMTTSEEEWMDAERSGDLMGQEEYFRLVGSLPRGKFAGCD